MVLGIFDCAPCMIAVLDLLHPANEITLLTLEAIGQACSGSTRIFIYK